MINHHRSAANKISTAGGVTKYHPPVFEPANKKYDMQLANSIALLKSNSIPSLSENSFLRYFNFIALYFAQGVPEGMLSVGIPAWMAMNGKWITKSD